MQVRPSSTAELAPRVPMTTDSTRKVANSLMRILVVDDDADIVSILEAELRLTGEFEPVTATVAREGLRLALTGEFDLILLDLLMPELDGLRFLEVLHNHEPTRDIPVVVLTAKTDKESIDLAFQKGAANYLMKPVAMELLTAQIKATMARSVSR